MGFILSGSLFTACDNGGNEGYYKPRKVNIETEFSNKYLQLFRFTVTSRDWQNVSLTDRFVKVEVPEITDEIIKRGAVIIYLNEVGRHVSLPFTYYQVKHAMSFQPSYELGIAYINILGNFIATANSTNTFKILVVTPKGVASLKKINLYNYEELKLVLEHKL